MLTRRVLSLVLLMSVAASAVAQSRPKYAVDDESTLTPEQTARTINVLPVYHRLQSLSGAKDFGDSPEFVALTQRMVLDVTTASLQVDATMGEIDAEIAETSELQNYLSARRQKTIDLLNLASLAIGGSVGTASAALGLTEHTHASGVLGVIAGSSTTALSVIGLGVRHTGNGSLDVPSNMLARIFDLPGDSNNVYPRDVARFMDSPAPNDPDKLTRQQRLIQIWTKVGRIPALDTPQGKAKVAKMASRPGDTVKLSIGDLDDRQAMLYDFRARLSFMKRDLAELLAGLPRGPMPDDGSPGQ
ncbi:hypothetical protein [Tunturiibacter lichenicola]|uniref:hypothetical protein n=1 Tax=Tunturiibacter lichenicola TaxID=2051959 RepID=UPI0021B49D3E|nr:hypothetical protein [Edaphobacter lichenicola]